MRRTVESCKKISVSMFKGNFLIGLKSCITWKDNGGNVTYQVYTEISEQEETGDKYLVLRHERENEELLCDYIRLTTTPCNLRGVRYWFICHCNRRVGTLFLLPGAVSFTCRTCNNLTYESCNTNKTVRKLMKNPELIESYVKSGSHKLNLLGLEACVMLKKSLNKGGR